MVKTLKLWWSRLGSNTLGRFIFSKVVGLLIPYTGTVRPFIAELKPGFAKVYLKDGRRVRNHLSSIHALALANVGELTTGLALHFALEEGDRAILTKLSVEYLKKARGKIRAEALINPDSGPSLGSNIVKAHLYDESQTEVCRVEATWLISR